MLRRLALVVSSCLVAASCTDVPATSALDFNRLNPAKVTVDASGNADAIVDRDTTTGLSLRLPVRLVARFDHDVDVRRLKVFGRDLRVEFDGAAAFEASPGQWVGSWRGAGGRAKEVTIRVTPTGEECRLEEVEFWGAGLPSGPRVPSLLAEASREGAPLEFDNSAAFRASPHTFKLELASNGGSACASVSIASTRAPASMRRAFLIYDAVGGVQRPMVLARSVNGRAPQGGLWLGSSEQRKTVIDELDPAWLTGDDVIRLCLPAEATSSVEVTDLRLVVEQDDGQNTLDRDALAMLGPAFDGDLGTATTVTAQPMVLTFGRPTAVDTAALGLTSPDAQLRVRAEEASGWTPDQTVEAVKGANPLTLDGRVARRLEVQFSARARADLPAAEVAELRLPGSGVGTRTEIHRIVVTYPQLTLRGGELHAEHFDGRALVMGWAEGPTGPALIEVDGAPGGPGDGTISTLVERPVEESDGWVATIRARFPDGVEVVKALHFDTDASDEILREGAPAGMEVSDDFLFGRENQTAWGRVDPKTGGTVTLGERVGFEAPAGAVASAINVGITRKAPEAVPLLDPGMLNVTAPENVAYRFSPPGQKFLKPTKVTLPYDSRLLPEGISAEQIQTYYFDAVNERWVSLPRVELKRATQQVVSETTHFTFMINAVLVMPEHPGVTSFNPTSLKELKAADPSAGIDFIEPPSANNQGTARVGFPIRLPRSRGAYQPDVRLIYDSGGGNGWVGVGWDVPVPSIQVETRFGVPEYTGEEIYLLEGQQLVARTAQGGVSCRNGVSGREYSKRVESDFKRIRRCGVTPNFHWEVTDKDGTLFVYGRAAESRLTSTWDTAIAEWYLERVVDPNGNLTLYTYQQDSQPTTGTGENWNRLYLSSIRYPFHVADPFADLGPGDTAAYSVHFINDSQPRDDAIVSARVGFKVATRFRLDEVRVQLDVGPGAGVIRSYHLRYIREQQGAGTSTFGRSLLSRIEVHGARRGSGPGPTFYTHDLDYFRPTPNDRAFDAPVPWVLGSQDDTAMTESTSTSVREGSFVGFAPTILPVKAIATGLNQGTTHGDTTTLSQFVDLNGDGLPDRLTPQGALFNQATPQGGARFFRREAPAGDPNYGNLTRYTGPAEVSLETVEGHDYMPQSAGITAISFFDSKSSSQRMLADADGDGRLDIVKTDEILFARPRVANCTGTSCCPLGEICFGSGVLGGVSTASASGTPMASVAGAHQFPTDAVVRWTAPRAGTIDLDVAFARMRRAPDGGDGARLEVYHELNDGRLTLLSAQEVPADDLAPHQALQHLDVDALDRLHFKLTTHADVPFAELADSGIEGLDEVTLTPVIQYTHRCSGRGTGCTELATADLTATDPDGHRTYRYVHDEEFRVAGGPTAATAVPVVARIAVSASFQKPATADDVVVCLQRLAEIPTRDERCKPSDLLFRTFAAGDASTLTTPAAMSLTQRFAAGTLLVFRVESDTPLDPGGIRLLPRLEYEEICDGAGGSCRGTTPTERAQLSSSPEAFVAIHPEKLLTFPARFVAPRDGKATFTTTLGTLPGAPVFLTIHVGDQLVMKRQAHLNEKVTLNVTTGTPIRVRVHANDKMETEPITLAGMELETSLPDGGVQTTNHNLLGFTTFSGDDDDLVRPFSGGYRGWSYARWNGLLPYGPDVFGRFDKAKWQALADADAGADVIAAEIGALTDGGTSAEALALEAFAPLVPRSSGIPLSAGRPVFATADGLAFVAANSAHGGRSQASSRTRPPGELRASENHGTGLSLSTPQGGLPIAGTWGTGATVQETMDLNGDGILDGISGSRVHLTRASDFDQGSMFELPDGGPARESETVTLQVSPPNPLLGLIPESPGPAGPVGKASGKVTASQIYELGVGLVKLAAGSQTLGVTRDSTTVDLLDVNGDGLPDRVERRGGELLVHLNLGRRFALHADHIPLPAWSTRMDRGSDFMRLPGGAVGQLVDFVARTENPNRIRSNVALTLTQSWGVPIGAGVGATVAGSVESSIAKVGVDFVDVNGDGLPDLVKKSALDREFLVQLNLGYGFAPEETWTTPPWGSAPPVPKMGLTIADALNPTMVAMGFNDRGAVDEVSVTATNSDPGSFTFGGSIPIFIPFCPPFVCPAIVLEGSRTGSTNRTGYELALQDIDGDGAADHVLKTRDSKFEIWSRPNKSALNKPGLLKSVSRPTGGSFELDYVRVGNTVDLPQSRWALSKVKVHSGRGAGATAGDDFLTTFTYQGGFYDRNEKDFLGFSKVTTTHGKPGESGDGSTVAQTFDDRTFALKGLLLSETTRDFDGDTFLGTENTLTVSTVAGAESSCLDRLPHPLRLTSAPCEVLFPELRTVTSRFHEGTTHPKVTAQRFQYDGFGNVSHFEDDADDGTADDITADIGYSTNLAGYIVNRPTSVIVKDSAGAELRNRAGGYDAKGNLETLTSDTGSGLAVATLTWETNGNLESVIGPANADGERYTVEYTYDPETDIYVASAEDSFKLKSFAAYDLRFGEATLTTDSNGNQTARAFDDFGRLTDIWGPYDIGPHTPTISMTYAPSATPARAVTRHKLPGDNGQRFAFLDTVVFADGLGRVLQTKKDAEVYGRARGYSVSGRVEFDVMGRVARQGQTFFSTAARDRFDTTDIRNPTAFAYDVLGRTIVTVEPNGATTTVRHGITAQPLGTGRLFFAEVTDALSNVRVVYRDVSDRVVAVEERIDGTAPTTRYRYNGLGELLVVTDAQGNVTSLGYDKLGRRTRLSNPDTGLTEFFFDAAGNLTRKVDANLRAARQAIEYQYDFNRLESVDYPTSEDVTFVYGRAGAPENGAGRVIEVHDEAGTETRGYGRLGEMTRSTRTVRPLRPGDGPRDFTTHFVFDSFGRMLSMTYPDGEVLTYRYDAGGLLRAAEGQRPGTGTATHEAYLTSLAYDEFGQRAYQRLGNGVETTFTYEPLTRRLSTLSTVAPGRRTLQALSYHYDDVGNVLSLTNALGEAVEGRSGEVSYVHTYDDLYRLTKTKGTAKSRPGVLDTFESSFTYDDIHNLTRNTQVRAIVKQVQTEGGPEYPPTSNHDWGYAYGGTAPHQATRIGDTVLTYDASGNTLTECRVPTGGTACPAPPVGGNPEDIPPFRRYVWQEDGRLSAVIDGGGSKATRFLYDAAGQRVVKLGQGGAALTVGQFFSVKGKQYATKHVFAGQARLASKVLAFHGGFRGASTSVGGGVPNTNGCVPSGNQPNKCPEAPTGAVPGGDGHGPRPATYYYHPDHLGSTAWMTDERGRVHERLEYFPYGEVWREGRDGQGGPPSRTPSFRFTGKEFDEETGLTYFGARYYDSKRARWASPDPALFSRPPTALLLSTYAYANLNAIAFIDPDGEEPVIVVGPHLLLSVQWKGSDEKQVVAQITDVRQSMGFRSQVRALIKRDFPELKDITAKTKVVFVDTPKEFVAAIKKSGPEGSKVFVGHMGFTKDPVTGAVTTHGPLLNELVTPEQLKDALKGVKGDVCFAGCASDKLKVPGGLGLSGTYRGYKTIGDIQVGLDADRKVKSKVEKMPENQRELDAKETTIQYIKYEPLE